jgi:hypothetical protein
MLETVAVALVVLWPVGITGGPRRTGGLRRAPAQGSQAVLEGIRQPEGSQWTH